MEIPQLSIDGQGGPPWEETVRASRELGLHAEQLFVVISRPVAGFGPVQAALGEHLPYQKKLEAKGVMVSAGPLANADGTAWDGEGIFIYRAASLDEAIRLAEQDPMHIVGARTFEIRAWCLNEGTSTLDRSA
jgi:uncharacterized protein YciI